MTPLLTASPPDFDPQAGPEERSSNPVAPVNNEPAEGRSSRLLRRGCFQSLFRQGDSREGEAPAEPRPGERTHPARMLSETADLVPRTILGAPGPRVGYSFSGNADETSGATRFR